MKLAKDIKEAIYEQVDYDLVASCFTGWEEVESIVAEKLIPIRDALKMLWTNPECMTPGDMIAQYTEALEMLEEE